jgi:hypothetical protein
MCGSAGGGVSLQGGAHVLFFVTCWASMGRSLMPGRLLLCVAVACAYPLPAALNIVFWLICCPASAGGVG